MKHFFRHPRPRFYGASLPTSFSSPPLSPSSSSILLSYFHPVPSETGSIRLFPLFPLLVLPSDPSERGAASPSLLSFEAAAASASAAAAGGRERPLCWRWGRSLLRARAMPNPPPPFPLLRPLHDSSLSLFTPLLTLPHKKAAPSSSSETPSPLTPFGVTSTGGGAERGSSSPPSLLHYKTVCSHPPPSSNPPSCDSVSVLHPHRTSEGRQSRVSSFVAFL